MKIAIITHTPHFSNGNQLLAYAPYVREMDLWNKNFDKVLVVAPVTKLDDANIIAAYAHPKVKLMKVSAFNVTTVLNTLGSLLKVPFIIWKLVLAMKQADHIHLRCPGNMGLLGCLVQPFFPKKKKTAKYAGNWDPNSKQPWSYKLQQAILRNTFLTRNMKVLVYGDWKEPSKNIVPFFTATYHDHEKVTADKTFQPPYCVFFAGTLSKGKQPMTAIKMVERLNTEGVNCILQIAGDGPERDKLEAYVNKSLISHQIVFLGNLDREELKKAYQKTHFLVLPSKSEGWPKVVAEAMFFGVIPVVSAVSCIPWMLGGGERGLLLSLELEPDILALKKLASDETLLKKMSDNAAKWSQAYTLEAFEKAVKNFI